MAKAIGKTKTIKKVVEQEIKDGVVLELSQLEAQFLRDLLGYCVEGSGPVRSLSNSIYDSLLKFTNANWGYSYNWSSIGSVDVDIISHSYISNHEVK